MFEEWESIMTSRPSESLVVVYSSRNEFESSIVKNMLEEEGISCYIEDSNSALAGLSTTPGHVLVPAEFESQARKLISEHEAEHRVHNNPDSDESD
jgi:hypothetical protein